MGELIGLLFYMVLSLPLVRTLALTLVPALALLAYVRKKDWLEPEPPKLVWGLFGLGVLSVIPAFFLELGALYVLSLWLDRESLVFRLIQWFLVVGLAEEGSKYAMLYKKTWKHPAFNCTFDAVVYAVAVSAGFALAENITYLINYGSSAMLIRALVSVPAHICFAVLMGSWYGSAKRLNTWEQPEKSRSARRLALLVPVLAHGLYDLIVSGVNSGEAVALFIIFVAVMFLVCFLRVRKLSNTDEYIA